MGKKRSRRALPPASQSKQPYVMDEDTALTLFHKPNVNSQGKGQLDCHSLIKSAFLEVSEEHVEWLARSIAFLTPEERTKTKKELGESAEDCEEFINLILETVEDTAQKDGKTVSKDTLDDGKTQCLSNYEQMFDDMYSRAEKVAADLEKDPQIRRARSNREEVNRILKATQGGASHYELLRLPSTADDKDIISAVRRHSMMVHPDRNDDKEAEECFKAIQGAGDILRDKTSRRDYDMKLKKSPNGGNGGSNSFEEFFHINAFDPDAEASDNEEPSRAQHPPPYDLARKAHANMEPALAHFFKLENLEIHANSVRHIMKYNQAIEKHNGNHDLDPALYQVDKDVLTVLRTEQVQKLKNAEKEDVDQESLQKEVEAFRDKFVSTCQQGIHQWPESWANLAVDPLVAKLKENGVSLTIQKAVEGGTDEQAPKKEQPGEDVEMPDRQGGGAPTHQVLSHHFEAGQSALGKILGYAPQTRYFRIQKQEVIQSFKFFVEVEGDNPLRLATDGDIGHPASMAYHNLPDGEKNDVRNSAKKYNRDMPPDKFQGIRGVAYDPHRRHTYVWVRMADETDSSKASILTRSALRDWLTPRYADKCIEDFFISQGDTPPWAKNVEEQDNHLQLQYPLPTTRGLGTVGPRAGHGTQDNVAPNAVDQLTARFDKLLEFLVDDRKQQQEERKEMMRLLPAA